MVENGIDPNVTGDDKETPLHRAATYGYFSTYRYLMEKSKVKNPPGGGLRTPLHLAALNGHMQICRLILRNVEEKNPSDMRRCTPLSLAATNFQFFVCFYLTFEILKSKLATFYPQRLINSVHHLLNMPFWQL